MAKNDAFIGFQEGRLRDKPVRLPVLVNDPDWFAVNKFAGLLPRAHPWYKDRPNLTQAIREQADAGKGELQRLGISQCFFICGPECEMAGPAIFAKNKQASNRLNNAFGSDQIGFRYWFLTKNSCSEAEMSCELPVGKDKGKPRAVISHRFGKKSCTHFRKLDKSEHLSLWEASTRHPRLHQIRLHAAELGISVFGDAIYGGETGRGLQRPSRKGSLAFDHRFSDLALAMVSMELSQAFDGGPLLQTLPPKPFVTLLRKCGLKQAE